MEANQVISECIKNTDKFVSECYALIGNMSKSAQCGDVKKSIAVQYLTNGVAEIEIVLTPSSPRLYITSRNYDPIICLAKSFNYDPWLLVEEGKLTIRISTRIALNF